MQKNPLTFFLRFLADPSAVGAIAPTSISAARLMASPIKNTDTVLELGAGNGTITQGILEKIPESQLIAVEKDTELANKFKNNFPNVDLRINDALLILDTIQPVDIIVSGIPFANLTTNQQEQFFHRIKRALKPSGTFVAIQYTKRVESTFKKHFASIETKRTWKNLPPTNVFICKDPK